MSSLLLTAPAIEPLSLAEAKAFLRVETGDDDDVIAALIAGARIHVEAQTRRALITQSWRLSIDAWPDDGRLNVLPAPLQTLTAARVYDFDNAAQTLDTAAFVLDKGASALIFAPNLATWTLPAPGRMSAGIELDVTAGYGDAAADVRAMKVEEAQAIYKTNYWAAQRCDELPAGVDDSVFVYGVNCGIGRSGKVLRRVLGLPDNDWRTGDDVLAALAKRDPKAVIVAICDERLRFLQSLKTWPVFGKGWGARVAEVKAFSLQLAAQAADAQAPAPQVPAPSPQIQQAGKGMVPAAKGVQQSSAATIVAAGAAAAQQAHQNGADPALIAGLVMVVAIAAILAWRFWDWRQQRQQDKPV